MKSRYGFTSQGKKAMIREINRQTLEQKDEFMKDIDAMILYTLHAELGFGKKRLERFYKAVIRNYKDMCAFYETDDTYPAEYKLREIGVDLRELRAEASE
jgi:hypothetical protein